jgi:hypothetical protein
MVTIKCTSFADRKRCEGSFSKSTQDRPEGHATSGDGPYPSA